MSDIYWNHCIRKSKLLLVYFLCNLAFANAQLSGSDTDYTLISIPESRVKVENNEIIVCDKDVNDTIKFFMFTHFSLMLDSCREYISPQKVICHPQTDRNKSLYIKYKDEIMEVLDNRTYKIIYYNERRPYAIVPFRILVIPDK